MPGFFVFGRSKSSKVRSVNFIDLMFFQRKCVRSDFMQRNFITKSELSSIKQSLNDKIQRIKFLDDDNCFESREILRLKAEVLASIDELKRISSAKKKSASSLRLL